MTIRWSNRLAAVFLSILTIAPVSAKAASTVSIERGLMLSFKGPCSSETARQSAKASARMGTRYALYRSQDKQELILFTGFLPSEKESSKIVSAFQARCPKLLVTTHLPYARGTGGRFVMDAQRLIVAEVRSPYGPVGNDGMDEALDVLLRRIRATTRSQLTVSRLASTRILVVGPPRLLTDKALFANVPPDLSFAIEKSVIIEPLDCIC